MGCPTSVPSGIQIHPTIWPQCTNITVRTDNGPIAFGNRFRTILQVVARPELETGFRLTGTKTKNPVLEK